MSHLVVAQCRGVALKLLEALSPCCRRHQRTPEDRRVALGDRGWADCGHRCEETSMPGRGIPCTAMDIILDAKDPINATELHIVFTESTFYAR